MCDILINEPSEYGAPFHVNEFCFLHQKLTGQITCLRYYSDPFLLKMGKIIVFVSMKNEISTKKPYYGSKSSCRKRNLETSELRPEQEP